AKEAAPELIKWLAENPDKSLGEAVEALGLKPVSMAEVEERLNKLLEEHRRLVEENPGKAVSLIMGELMKHYRGKVDGAKLYKLVSGAVRGQKSG
ncbi:MAG TPA: Glu-tRNA(Gln) amidotransferase GatDE subunit E, partial [Nitrososphaeria archaeon]|nr:Glu-tRNA(Gln) amidotransferase GatDE subunit E [Nitrososphaeria archaeon]